MKAIKIDATSRTPKVDFEFAKGVFSIRGESYPENVSEFFGPLVTELNEYLKGLGGSGDVRFNFRLAYFNSSTAKILIGLFDALEGAAKTGVQVRLAWYYDPEDDTMKEFGEELSEELEHAEFELIAQGE